jgi:hypothetical protein
MKSQGSKTKDLKVQLAREYEQGHAIWLEYPWILSLDILCKYDPCLFIYNNRCSQCLESKFGCFFMLASSVFLDPLIKLPCQD